jgi:hypothetical protein
VGLTVLLAWIVALAVAVVVLGFCAYEIVWKARRLSRDLAGLQELDERMGTVREQLAVTQDRLAAARIGS